MLLIFDICIYICIIYAIRQNLFQICPLKILLKDPQIWDHIKSASIIIWGIDGVVFQSSFI